MGHHVSVSITLTFPIVLEFLLARAHGRLFPKSEQNYKMLTLSDIKAFELGRKCM